ncbi:metallophosphoesterase family protein [Sphingomonas sp. DT-204]|uniref:metallophosphoesterase family protein n=1 Tax=Sphingomonas sp. DT-204 TaxID=3396166 RepID=UPI003F1A7BF4
MALSLLRRFGLPVSAALASVPEGERVYAIGDVHGRLDLLDRLLEQIAADDAARGPARSQLIFLGDLIDRGPQSREVVERVMRLTAERPDTRVIAGNHEEMLLAALRSERGEAMRFFIQNGGRETLLSYGISEEEYEAGSLTDLRDLARGRIPVDHVAFLRSLEPYVAAGDYLFVHAGIRPGVAIEEQSSGDLQWIRGEFLSSKRDHGRIVVHGHTVSEGIDEQPNRIGIDTGAFATGNLTAIGLEATERWYLSTLGSDAAVPSAAIVQQA